MARVGRALDLAAGNGRNAFHLARLGFRVDAIDISDEAVQSLVGRHPMVQAIRADLDRYDLPERTFQLIVNTHFLDRRLFPHIMDALLPGGVLIFETFIASDAVERGPSHRDHLLMENELLHAFFPLGIRYYREMTKETEQGRRRIASLVARKPF
jgi:SAM-dependent methyltransferase